MCKPAFLISRYLCVTFRVCLPGIHANAAGLLSGYPPICGYPPRVRGTQARVCYSGYYLWLLLSLGLHVTQLGQPRIMSATMSDISLLPGDEARDGVSLGWVDPGEDAI